MGKKSGYLTCDDKFEAFFKMYEKALRATKGIEYLDKPIIDDCEADFSIALENDALYFDIHMEMEERFVVKRREGKRYNVYTLFVYIKHHYFYEITGLSTAEVKKRLNGLKKFARDKPKPGQYFMIKSINWYPELTMSVVRKDKLRIKLPQTIDDNVVNEINSRVLQYNKELYDAAYEQIKTCISQKCYTRE